MRRLVHWPRRSAKPSAPGRSQEEIDYLSEEIFHRILARARVDAGGDDLVESFTAAAQGVELPAHVRLQQLSRRFSFWLQHPILAYKLAFTRRALKHAALSSAPTDDISLERQCIRTLSSIEFSQTLKAPAARQARAIATHCDWGPSRLRDAIRMGVLRPSLPGAALQLTKPNRPSDVLLLVFGGFFGNASLILIGYSILTVATCDSLDCSALGNLILGWICLSFSWLMLYSVFYRTWLFNKAKPFISS